MVGRFVTNMLMPVALAVTCLLPNPIGRSRLGCMLARFVTRFTTLMPMALALTCLLYVPHCRYAMNSKQMLKTLAAQERILIKRNGFLYAFRTSQVCLAI